MITNNNIIIANTHNHYTNTSSTNNNSSVLWVDHLSNQLRTEQCSPIIHKENGTIRVITCKSIQPEHVSKKAKINEFAKLFMGIYIDPAFNSMDANITNEHQFD